jgi:hypothetical protein
MKLIIQLLEDNKMKSNHIYIFWVVILLSSKCKEPAMDRDYPLYLKNKSGMVVRVYFNDNEFYKAVYPDTGITNYSNRIGIAIKPNSLIDVAGGSAKWESVYQVSVPNDTMSIFVLHDDTVSTYPWDTIRARYLILQRYDLSLKDLENRNFEIEYPYDPNRGKLKVWKP